jgi:cation:H+ antiporter
MLPTLAKFFIGSFILLVSTQQFIKYSKKISGAIKISPLIVGFILLAIGTSLPELSFSFMASIRQDVGLAMGNIIGSNITNVLFVFAIGILMGKLRVGTSKTQTNSIILLLATALFITLQLIQIPPKISGIILMSSAILITFIVYLMGVTGRANEDRKMFKNNKKIVIKTSLIFVPILLIVGVIAGSFIAVSSIEEFSALTRINTTVLGLSLTAIVTSFPELLATIFGQKDNQDKLTLGNILGSNIYNLLLIGGIVNLLSGKNGIKTINWVALALVTALFFYITKKFSGKNIPRKYGVFLLILFGLYLLKLQ